VPLTAAPGGLQLARRLFVSSGSSEVASSDRSNTSPLIHGEKQMGELIDKVKGKIKQTAGALAGDKKLEDEGELDEAKGEVKGAVANVKHAVKEAARK
jgi:uncharacterized protein YjbJ (UPF0337 family)